MITGSLMAGRSGQPRVTLLVNGGEDSAMGIRARSLVRTAGDRVEARIVYRGASRARSIGDFGRRLRGERPDLVYVLDMAYSGVLAAALHGACSRCRVIIDTGDAIFALARSSAIRGPVGLGLTWALEEFGLRRADHIVVRGTRHAELLRARSIAATVIPDGVDVEQFAAMDGSPVRDKFSLGRAFAVGLVGSSIWSDRLQMCYGWELVESLALIHDRDVCGLMIGDGDGIERLRRRAAELRVSDRLRFAGRVPYDQLPAHIAAMDVCLSTQTNDIPGQVRTTGKLPLYLAAGGFGLASRVGEGARVLPEPMLVEYSGTRDPTYPARLAERLAAVRAMPDRATLAARGVTIARREFAYDVLAERWINVIFRTLRRSGSAEAI